MSVTRFAPRDAAYQSVRGALTIRELPPEKASAPVNGMSADDALGHLSRLLTECETERLRRQNRFRTVTIVCLLGWTLFHIQSGLLGYVGWPIFLLGPTLLVLGIAFYQRGAPVSATRVNCVRALLPTVGNVRDVAGIAPLVAVRNVISAGENADERALRDAIDARISQLLPRLALDQARALPKFVRKYLRKRLKAPKTAPAQAASAALALGLTADKKARVLLLETAGSHVDETVRAAATEALSELESELESARADTAPETIP